MESNKGRVGCRVIVWFGQVILLGFFNLFVYIYIFMFSHNVSCIMLQISIANK